MFPRLLCLSCLLTLSLFVTGQNDCFNFAAFPIIPQDILTKDDSTQKKIMQEFSVKAKAFYQNNVEGCKIPDFKAELYEGGNISMRSLKGKVVVIYFWSTEFEPIFNDIPVLNEIVKKFKDKNVVFIGMTKDSREILKSDFFPKYTFDFKIACNCSLIANKLCAIGVPITYVIDKKGIVKKTFQHGFTGGSDQEYMKKFNEDFIKTIEGCL